jgi:ribosomal protein S18 acetylase RimI-like enzyme
MDENMEQYENWANRKFARLVTGGASALADEAIGYALAHPFQLTVSAEEPLVSSGPVDGLWEWAVFSSCPPGKSLRKTERALRREVRDARKLDKMKYSDKMLLETSGLAGEAALWPCAEGSWDFNVTFPKHEYACAGQSYRLVLCSPTKVAGFCAVTTTATYSLGDAAPDLDVRIWGGFVSPAYRGRELSNMLAEGAAVVVLDMVRQLQDRLVALQISQVFDVELQVQGELDSNDDLRFLFKIKDWLERLIETTPLISEGGESVLRIKDVVVCDV